VGAILVADNVEVSWEHLVAFEAKEFQIPATAFALGMPHRHGVRL